MLTVGDFVGVNSGSFDGTSGNATLPATTAGNTVVIVVQTPTVATNLPSGFVSDGATSSTTFVSVFRKSGVSAGETSWALSNSIGQLTAWVAMELSGLAASPLDAQINEVATSVANGSNWPDPTGGSKTPDNAAVDTVVLVAHGAEVGNATPPSWASQTNGFEEFAEQSAASAIASVGLSVSRKLPYAIGPFRSSATLTTPAVANTGYVCVVYAAVDSPYVPIVVAADGFEYGPAAGLTTGPNPVLASITGSPTIVSGDALATGNYCLECTGTSPVNVVLGGSANGRVDQVSLWFPSSLPANDLELAFIETASSDLVLRYRTASQKLAVQVGAGSEVLSDLVVSAGVKISVNLRLDQTGATYFGDWQIDYGDGVYISQAQASGSGTAGSAVTGVRLGRITGAAGTVRYDDVVAASNLGSFPLADCQVIGLLAEAVSVNGTTANVNTFTNNGTMATFDAAAALAAIDEVPPTVGASADGIAGVAGTSGTDIIIIGMHTYQAVPTHSIRAVRVLICGWAAGTQANNVRWRGYDGTEEVTIFSIADPNFDNTSTPGWICKMHNPSGGWTQTKLDNLEYWMTWGDPTPNIGLHAIYAQVVLAAAQAQGVFGTAGDINVTAQIDPKTASILSLETATPGGKGTDVVYEESSIPTTITVPADSSNVEVIDAPDFPTVNLITLQPDPEPPLA